MRVVMFYHSLVSDWNHGNAHFLRGVARELRARGHDVMILEPRNAWSRVSLEAEYGFEPIRAFELAYPGLRSRLYELGKLDLDLMLDGANLVLVHEWNDHELVRRVGEHRARVGGYQLFFHDTHHRAVTAADSMAAYDLSAYDGALVFGEVLRDIYLRHGWVQSAWVWHEAADTQLFRPLRGRAPARDLIWIGNWGDEERSGALREFLIEPVRRLGLTARVHGVRYPDTALRALAEAGIEYAGWLPNYEVPAAFAQCRATVHIPRRPYVRALPGIPTIRMFEALGCGIPLVTAPWDDTEGLFTPGQDFLVARDGEEMVRHLRAIRNDPELARGLAARGRRTVLERHTCAHRVDELLAVMSAVASSPSGKEAEDSTPVHARTLAV